jgi:methyl-accepting chemotaxis protein
MAKTIELFRLSAIDRADLEQKQSLNRTKEIERQKRLDLVVAGFQKEIVGVIELLNTQTSSIQVASADLADVAARATENAQSATQASNGASENAQAVAAASEELGASIREIASQAHRTSDLVTQTTAVTRKSNEDVGKLDDAAQKIGSIVEFIKNVAEQTNLLALNATIEAARAGEAGRGFAVVATEVKNLAAQTAKATSDISSQIQSIQLSTKQTVGAIQQITGRVDEITSLTCGIAAAVEEQDAATREIAQNVTSAAMRSRTAAESVWEMQAGADKTRNEAAKMSKMSGALAEAARHISKTFERFLSDLASDLDERRKSVRHPFTAPVSILSGAGRFETTAQDVSLHGLRIALVPGLAPGAHVKLDFGMGAMGAKCIWSNSSAAGMAFDQPLEALPDLDVKQIIEQKEAA